MPRDLERLVETPDLRSAAQSALDAANRTLDSLPPTSALGRPELEAAREQLLQQKQEITRLSNRLAGRTASDPNVSDETALEAPRRQLLRLADRLDQKLAEFETEEKKNAAAAQETRNRVTAILDAINKNRWVTAGTGYALLCLLGVVSETFYSRFPNVGIDFWNYSQIADFFFAGFGSVMTPVAASVIGIFLLVFGRYILSHNLEDRSGRTLARYKVLTYPLTRPLWLGLSAINTIAIVGFLSAYAQYALTMSREPVTVLLQNPFKAVENVRMLGSTGGYFFVGPISGKNSEAISLRRDSVICVASSSQSSSCAVRSASRPDPTKNSEFLVIHNQLASITNSVKLIAKNSGWLSTAQYAKRILGCDGLVGDWGTVDFSVNQWDKGDAWLATGRLQTTHGRELWSEYKERIARTAGDDTIWVLGFASADGDVNHNMELSEQRANWIAGDLVTELKRKREGGAVDVRTRGLGEELLVGGRPGPQRADQRAEIVVCRQREIANN